MINSIVKSYTISKRDTGVDSIGQPLKTYKSIGTADISVLLYTQRLNESDIRYKSATHIGLTFDKSILEDYRISYYDDIYLVQLVNNFGRMSQLTLKKV